MSHRVYDLKDFHSVTFNCLQFAYQITYSALSLRVHDKQEMTLACQPRELFPFIVLSQPQQMTRSSFFLLFCEQLLCGGGTVHEMKQFNPISFRILRFSGVSILKRNIHFVFSLSLSLAVV